MADILPGIIALIFAIFVLIDGCIIIASFVYSRYIFSRYLMTHHRQKWEELVYKEYQGLNWFSFDKTLQLQKFRTESTEDLGDPNIRKMRQLSIYLFKTGVTVLLSFIVIFLVVGIASLLIRGK